MQSSHARPCRRAVRAVVTTAAAAATLLSGVALAAPATAEPTGDAQVVDGNAFMTNGIVEVGARPNGSFGSDIGAPEGYHPRSGGNGSILGFRSDRDGDGWGTGTDDGDFFAPGSPYEAFGVQVGSGSPHVNSSNGTSISGSFGDASSTDAGQTLSWTSSSPVDGLSISQKATIAPGRHVLSVDVTLTNASTETLKDLVYVRAVDPDNCKAQVDASCSGSYDTTNTIVSQQTDGVGRAVVSATASDGSYLDLRSSARGSVVVRDYPWEDSCADLKGLWDGGCGDSTADSSGSGDLQIGLGVRTASLKAGASRTFRVQYVLSAPEADDIDSGSAPYLAGSTLDDGHVGESYSASVAAEDGTAPITYAVTAGELPAGLELDEETGAITGTPTTEGAATFTVTATNSKGTDVQKYSIAVGAQRTAPELPTGDPVSGTQGVEYSQSVAASGTQPITYTVDAGELPAGLSLDASTGVISGTPTAVGSSTFTIKATNVKGSDTQEYTLVVAAAAVAPGVPGVSVKPGDRRLTLTVTAPTSDGGSPVTGYEYTLDGTTWRSLDLVQGKAVVKGLRNTKRYTLKVRAVNAVGAGEPKTVTATAGWFHDPLTPAARKALRSIPKHPSSYDGRLRRTKAFRTNASGRPAVTASAVKGRHLSKGQAVVLGGSKAFAFDSPKPSRAARKQLRALVPALADAKAVRCEGYTDYADKAGTRHERKLAKARASAVCSYLRSHGAKVRTSLLAVGAKRPVVVGGTAKKRADNRRVVITVTK